MAYTNLKDGQLHIAIGEFRYQLRLRERSAPGGEPLPYGRERDRLPRWQRARQTRFLPTGELRLTIEGGYARKGRQAEFRDTKRSSLENRLPDVLRELEIRGAEDDWPPQQQWTRPGTNYRQAWLAEVLRGQLENWRLGKELDSYLAELEAHIPDLASRQERAAAGEWLAWARQFRHNIDPLHGSLSMPQIAKPSPADLEPFLRGWSPYGPGG